MSSYGDPFGYHCVQDLTLRRNHVFFFKLIIFYYRKYKIIACFMKRKYKLSKVVLFFS